MSLRDETRRRLEEAMERLLTGVPTGSAGDLTISGWAREAGVHRATPYRSPELLTEFTKRVAETNQQGGNELHRLRARLTTMQSENDRLRQQRSERERALEAHNRALANQLNATMIELEQAARRLAPKPLGPQSLSRQAHRPLPDTGE